MFTHMVLIKKLSHRSRNTIYELFVCQAVETGEYQIYIAKGGLGVGDIFTASEEVVQDGKRVARSDIVEELISSAIDDINRNELGLY